MDNFVLSDFFLQEISTKWPTANLTSLLVVKNHTTVKIYYNSIWLKISLSSLWFCEMFVCLCICLVVQSVVGSCWARDCSHTQSWKQKGPYRSAEALLVPEKCPEGMVLKMNSCLNPDNMVHKKWASSVKRHDTYA